MSGEIEKSRMLTEHKMKEIFSEMMKEQSAEIEQCKLDTAAGL